MNGNSCYGLTVFVTLAGCASVTVDTGGAPSDAAVDAMVGGAPSDAAVDAMVGEPGPTCGREDIFSTPVLLDEFAFLTYRMRSPRLTADERTMYFASDNGPEELWVTRRASRAERFQPPERVPVSTEGRVDHRNPTISRDNLRLIFEATDDPAADPANLYMAQRSDEQSEFGPPEAISGLNGAGWDTQPFLTADGQELWYATWRPDQGGYKIYRVPVDGSFGVPEFRDEFSSLGMEVPTLSADKLTIFLVAQRTDNRLGIWSSSRATTEEEFPAPVLVPELNSTETDRPGWLSPDNCRLYLSSERSGRFQIYVATRQPG